MSTYTQILYQVIFGTKRREKIMTKSKREDLYKYMTGVLQAKKCHIYRINGVEDHLHILIDLHPEVALASLIKDLKISSGKFIKDKKLFKNFKGWQKGYGAFTYSIDRKKILIEYIKNQEEHHRKKSSREELIKLLKKHGIDYDEKYLE